MQYSGVDVSEVQGSVNWRSAERGGIEFAMIRTTYGSSGVDGQFLSNITGISQTGIYPGAYHESSAQTVNEAVMEASHFINTIRPYKFYYPVALKIESESAMQTGKEFFTNIISAFIGSLRDAGYYPMICGSTEWIENSVDLTRLSDVDIWLVDFSVNREPKPPFEKNITIVRYSDRGSVPGIAGNANLDISYVNYPPVIRNEEAQKNSFVMNKSTFNAQNRNTEPDFSEPEFYTVRQGDTLRSIAEKMLGDPEKYRSIMELNGFVRPIIFEGQTLRLPAGDKDGVILYRVKQGDTLWKIAERFLGYGPRYNEIMALSGIATDMIYPGEILKIPAEKSAASQTYVVKQSDTLWKIAQNELGDGKKYTEIMLYNNLKNGNIRVGQVLVIPSR